MASLSCPLCGKRYPRTFIAAHAASCDPTVSKRSRPSSSTVPHTYKTAPSSSGPVSEVGAPGFHLFRGVFSDIEPKLLHQLHVAPPQWTDFHFRKAKQYGPAYNIYRRKFLLGPDAPPRIPFPLFAHDLVLPRLRNLPGLAEFRPNQLAVQEYPASNGHIKPHNDCENGFIGTAVVGVSLSAQCIMTLILRARFNGLGKDVKKDVVLPRGSVYIMSGDALRVWEHAIFAQNIEGIRHSLTFRDVHLPKDETSGSVNDTPWSAINKGSPHIQNMLRNDKQLQHKTIKKKDGNTHRPKRRRLVQQKLG